jgi:hypothetical protein
MLWARSARRELARSRGWSTGGPLRIAACGSAGRSAVEDWLAALNARACGLVSGAGSRGNVRGHNGSLVYRAWPSLGHDYAPGWKRDRGGCRMCMTFRAAMSRWWRELGGSLSIDFNRGGWRRLLRWDSGGLRNMSVCGGRRFNLGGGRPSR